MNGRILWASRHLLFRLSLIPFVTQWLGEIWNRPGPVRPYGIVMLGAGAAFYVLTHSLIRHHGCDSALASAVGSVRKEMASLVLYALAVPLAFVDPRIACALYVTVAIVWLVPDRRIERLFNERTGGGVGDRGSTGPA